MKLNDLLELCFNVVLFAALFLAKNLGTLSLEE